MVTLGRILYGVPMITTGFIYVIGYAMFILTIWNRKDLQKKSIPIMSLCVSDLCMVFLHMVVAAIANFSESWPHYLSTCQFNAFAGIAFSLVSIWNFAFAVWDVYLKKIKSEKQSLNYGFYIATIWMGGLTAGYLPFLGIGEYGFENSLNLGCLITYNNPSRGIFFFIAMMTIFFFLLPILAILHSIFSLEKETGTRKPLIFCYHLFLCAWMIYGLTSSLALVFTLDSLTMIFFTNLSSICAKFCFALNPYVFMYIDADLRTSWKEKMLKLRPSILALLPCFQDETAKKAEKSE